MSTLLMCLENMFVGTMKAIERKRSTQCVKWTDLIVKLLIAAVSYIGEDVSNCSGRRQSPILPKKKKWEAISEVLAERCCHLLDKQKLQIQSTMLELEKQQTRQMGLASLETEINKIVLEMEYLRLENGCLALKSKGKKWVTTPTEFSMHWLVLSFCFQLHGEGQSLLKVAFLSFRENFPRLEVAIVIKMESNLSLPGDMMRVDHQQVPYPWQVPDAFSFQVGSMQKFDQPLPLLDRNKDERLNNFSGNSQWTNILGALNEQNEVGAEKREPVWQRIKWTDEMVKLLITAVSYVEEDALSDANNRERRNLFLPLIKGKWRAISNTMVERGYIVSPQQCEDKFNDLNKKYRRLNDMLGRRTSCEVVENPVVLESINISNETKEEAKKILTCKQLFYREMCSYHNRNRIFLLHDEALQQSLRSALKVKYESKDVIQAVAAKRQKLRKDHGVVNLDGPENYVECTRSDPQSPKELANANSVLPMGVEGEQEQNQRIVSRSLQLKKHMLQLRREMLELEKKKFEWLKSSQEEDMELIKMKQVNELMKLENERLAFELTCREMGSDSK